MKTKLTPRIPVEIMKGVKMMCVANGKTIRDYLKQGLETVQKHGIERYLPEAKQPGLKRKTSIIVDSELRDRIWGIGLTWDLSLEITIAVLLVAGYPHYDARYFPSDGGKNA